MMINPVSSTLLHTLASGGSRVSRRGAPTLILGLFCKFFAENYMKMKKYGPQGGIPGAPLWIRQCFHSAICSMLPSVVTSHPHPWRVASCSVREIIIYMDTIHYAILFLDTSTILNKTKLISNRESIFGNNVEYVAM